MRCLSANMKELICFEAPIILVVVCIKYIVYLDEKKTAIHRFLLIHLNETVKSMS